MLIVSRWLAPLGYGPLKSVKLGQRDCSVQYESPLLKDNISRNKQKFNIVSISVQTCTKGTRALLRN